MLWYDFDPFYIIFFFFSFYLSPLLSTFPSNQGTRLWTSKLSRRRITESRSGKLLMASRVIQRYYYSCSPMWPVSFLRRRGLRSSLFTKGYIPDMVGQKPKTLRGNRRVYFLSGEGLVPFARVYYTIICDHTQYAIQHNKRVLRYLNGLEIGL